MAKAVEVSFQSLIGTVQRYEHMRKRYLEAMSFNHS